VSTAVSVLDTHSPFGTYRAEGMVRFAWALADRHDFSKRLRKGLRALAGRLFRGPYDTEVEGLKFRIYPGENYDDRKILAKRRLPEKAEHALIAPFLEPGTVFVDVGANIGTYALYAARRGARVVAIEANPETAAKLSYNVAANAAEMIEVVETAIGAEEGCLALWSEPSNRGFATLVKELTTGEWAGDWRPLKVKVRPLARVLAERDLARADVLKVDVEGFEDRVLVPYLTSLSAGQLPKVVMLETNCHDHWETDCVACLADRGYSRAGETKDNALYVLTRQ